MTVRSNTKSPARAKLAKTVAAAPAAASAKPAAADTENATLMQRWDSFIRAQEALLDEIGAPSTARKIMAFVSTVVVAVGLGWLLGQVLSALFIGMVLLTGTTFLAWVLYALGLVLGAFFGGKFAARVGGAVLTGEADERAQAAYNAVRHYATAPLRWLRGDKRAVAAA